MIIFIVEPKDWGPPSATIKLRNIPHGFYEKQLLGFFSQFGDVVRVQVPRSEKKGKPRGIAYVQFEDREVSSAFMLNIIYSMLAV